MRLLPAGDDNVGHCAAFQEPKSERARRCAVYGRERLPVRDLPSNRQRHPQSRPVDEGRRTMSDSNSIDKPVELERYELFSEPAYHFDFELGRRDFFKLLGGGLV